jgi:putative transcriptional regulator
MIQVNLDVMMAKRKISLNELAKRMDISLANLSILKNNKCRAIRFSTLGSLCEILNCDAGDILVYLKGGEPNGTESDAE